jgi:phage terminase large subunit GpA-like protein
MAEAALARYMRETERHLERVCRFRRTLSAPEWSEKIRRMEGGKRFRFDFAPYQREMMETPFRPDVQLTAYMMASRMGKTEVVMNIIGHAIAEDPRKILVGYPVADDAEKWSKETLMQQTVEPTPELARLVGDGEGRRLANNTILHKVFPGGLLSAFGMNAPGKIRRAKGNLIFADEIDAIKQNEADEGDPLEILWVRGSEYPDTIKIAAAYPSVKGRSKIESLMLKSDYRMWFVPCIHCGAEFVLTRKLLKYDRDNPAAAWLECPDKGCKITDAERLEMIKLGEWRPTRPFTGIAGFHGSRMMSPHPPQKGFDSHLHWAAVEEMKIESSDNREKALRVLINTFDAETYQAPEEEKPDPMGLAQEAYEYLERVSENQLRIPAGCLVITCGADVQGDRVEVEFVGHGANGQAWGLGYHVLAGNPSEPEVWVKFDALLQSEFLHPCGKVLKAVSTFIDSKYKQSNVLAFTKPRQANGVFAIFGSTVLGKPIVSEPKRQPRGILYEIGTHEAKAMIYQNAALRRDRRSSDFPHNYMHFPLGHGYTVEYFQRLLIEDVSLKKATDGNFYEFFEKRDKRDRNEPLDVRVYNIAAARKLRINFAAVAKNYAEYAAKNPADRGKEREYALNFVAD